MAGRTKPRKRAENHKQRSQDRRSGFLVLEPDVFRGCIRHAVAELVATVDTLRGMASALERAGELTFDAEAMELREAGIHVRASATSALLAAVGACGIAERLVAVAMVKRRPARKESRGEGDSLTAGVRTFANAALS